MARATVDGETRAVLAELLVSAFDAGQIRRLAASGREGDAVAARLPVEGSLVELAHDYVEELDRRGYIDAQWLARLAEERPGRAHEIAAIEARIHAGRATPAPVSAGRRRYLMAGVLTLLVLLLVLAAWRLLPAVSQGASTGPEPSPDEVERTALPDPVLAEPQPALDVGSIPGRVLHADGAPLANALVRLDEGCTELPQAATDDAGVFELSPVPPACSGATLAVSVRTDTGWLSFSGLTQPLATLYLPGAAREARADAQVLAPPVVDLVAPLPAPRTGSSFPVVDDAILNLPPGLFEDGVRQRLAELTIALGQLQIGGGSGLSTVFYVGSGLVLTGRSPGLVPAMGEPAGVWDQPRPLAQAACVRFFDAYPRAARCLPVAGVRLVHPHWNLVALELEEVPAWIEALALRGDRPAVKGGEAVSLLGYPGGGMLHVLPSTVVQLDPPPAGVLLHRAPAQPGTYGGPLLHEEEGLVWGIQLGPVEGLSFALPTWELFSDPLVRTLPLSFVVGGETVTGVVRAR